MAITEKQYNDLDAKVDRIGMMVDKILASLETQLDSEPGVLEKVRVLWTQRKVHMAWVERGGWVIFSCIVGVAIKFVF